MVTAIGVIIIIIAVIIAAIFQQYYLIPDIIGYGMAAVQVAQTSYNVNTGREQNEGKAWKKAGIDVALAVVSGGSSSAGAAQKGMSFGQAMWAGAKTAAIQSVSRQALYDVAGVQDFDINAVKAATITGGIMGGIGYATNDFGIQNNGALLQSNNGSTAVAMKYLGGTLSSGFTSAAIGEVVQKQVYGDKYEFNQAGFGQSVAFGWLQAASGGLRTKAQLEAERKPTEPQPTLLDGITDGDVTFKDVITALVNPAQVLADAVSVGWSKISFGGAPRVAANDAQVSAEGQRLAENKLGEKQLRRPEAKLTGEYIDDRSLMPGEMSTDMEPRMRGDVEKWNAKRDGIATSDSRSYEQLEYLRYLIDNDLAVYEDKVAYHQLLSDPEISGKAGIALAKKLYENPDSLGVNIDGPSSSAAFDQAVANYRWLKIENARTDFAAGKLENPITREQLTTMFPQATNTVIDSYLPEFNAQLSVANISSVKERAYFFATINAETRGLTDFEEGFKYSDPSRARNIFRNLRGMSDTEVSELGNGDVFANTVYANINGNGDIASGDGFEFRGRGVFQNTGRNNYRVMGDNIGIDLENNPGSLITADISVATAIAHWEKLKVGSLTERLPEQVPVVNGQVRDANFRRSVFVINSGLENIKLRADSYNNYVNLLKPQKKN